MKIKNICLLAIIACASAIPMLAFAETPGAMEIVDGALKTARGATVTKIQTTAIMWLSLFIGLQFVITNIGLLRSGADIQAVFAKLAGSIAWFTFCFYVMSNGVDFVDKVTQQFFTTAADVAGTGNFSASYLTDWGLNLAAGLLDSVDKAKGGGILAKLDFLPSIFAGVAALVILATAALIGFKIFMIKIEVTMIIMLAPLSFALLGLDALKDQGIAPFKALVSLAYRILLLGVIVSAMGVVGDDLMAVFSKVESGSITDIWKPVFGSLFGYLLLGYLAYRSDSIASSLASGGTNMGTADVGIGAAAGGAAGGVIGGAIGAMAGGAAKIGQPMSDVIKSMMGTGGGSIANASPFGAGGASSVGDAPPAPAKTPELSVADNNAMRMRLHPQPAGPELTGGSPASSLSAGSGSSAPASDGDTSSATTPESAGQAASPSGSGAKAGIGGTESATNEKLDKLLAGMNTPAAKPSISQRTGDFARKLAEEQSTTHVSINANAGAGSD